MNTPYDPTAVLVNRPRVPMTPEQLAALRPKPVVTHEDGSAKAIAYRCGIKELEPLVLRIEELESQVRNLVTLIPQLLEVAGVKVQ